MRFSVRALLLLLICTLVCSSPWGTGAHAMAEELPLVVVVTTGGTIAMKTDTKTKGAVPAVSGQDLLDSVPALTRIARIRVVPFCNIDSSQMTPEIWLKLSAKVDAILAEKEVKGVVITHGTDAMALGAFFLDVTLTSSKPVVFTGAMRDASAISPDGPLNIFNAVKQVTMQERGQWGVTLTMNQFVAAAIDVRKVHTTNSQCFESGPAGYLGYVGADELAIYRQPLPVIKVPKPKSLPPVTVCVMHPANDGRLLRSAVDLGYKGIVIQAVGAGNVNEAMYKSIKYALANKVAVVVTTQVYYGGVQAIYGDAGGGVTLMKAGCILGGTLISSKASLLLALGLANYGNSEKLRQLF